jgi:hypothetical protein
MLDYEQIGSNLWEVFNANTGTSMYLVNSEEAALQEMNNWVKTTEGRKA